MGKRRRPVPREWRWEHHYLTTSGHIAGGGWGGHSRIYRTRGKCSCGVEWPDSPNTDNLNYEDVLDFYNDHVEATYYNEKGEST